MQRAAKPPCCSADSPLRTAPSCRTFTPPSRACRAATRASALHRASSEQHARCFFHAPASRSQRRQARRRFPLISPAYSYDAVHLHLTPRHRLLCLNDCIAALTNACTEGTGHTLVSMRRRRGPGPAHLAVERDDDAVAGRVLDALHVALEVDGRHAGDAESAKELERKELKVRCQQRTCRLRTGA